MKAFSYKNTYPFYRITINHKKISFIKNIADKK